MEGVRMKKIVLSLGLTALLLMAGCAKQFVQVDPSTQQFGPVSFTTAQPWNKVDINADHSMWTVDGLTLNTLELTGNVGKGTAFSAARRRSRARNSTRP